MFWETRIRNAIMFQNVCGSIWPGLEDEDVVSGPLGRTNLLRLIVTTDIERLRFCSSLQTFSTSVV